MTVTGYSNFEITNARSIHRTAAARVANFLNDLGEDCDIILQFDDPEEDFEFFFSGTTLSLLFDNEGIHVLDYDPDADEEYLIESFENPLHLNQAVHCLVTQAN
jgi:hypothetical protein